jgi:glutathione S-transferase
LKLYYFPVAPNPTKVRVYLAEKGRSDALEMVRVSLGEGEQRTPGFLAKNPQGKLPVLELDDGTYVAESLAIIEYLEERFPDPPMIGATPEERAHTRSVERMTDMRVASPVARAVHATRSPLGMPPDPALAADALRAAADGLGLLDDRLASTAFIAGDRVSIADCTLWAALTFGAIFGVELDPKFENVSRWKAEFAERPSTQLPG